MLETPDLAVLGAGPAGVNGALAAREAGLTVVLIDEAPFAGGQVYRAPLDGSAGQGSDGEAGDRLRRRLADSDIAYLPGHRVWTVSTTPLRLSLAGPGPLRTIRPRAVLVATGATERVVPFPGWTLPGVIGLAAATVLLKTPGPPPPGPIVVAGRGPLLAATAAGLLARGAHVSCVVDEAPRADWIKALPALLSRPDLLARGALWLARIRKAGVPILHGHAVTAGHGSDALQSVDIAPVDGDGRSRSGRGRAYPARLLAVGHGLVPSTDVLAMFGVPLQRCPDTGAWLPTLDTHGRTSIAGLYAAGDGTGISGAAAAELGGRLAGAAVAKDLGGLSDRQHAAIVSGAVSRLHRARTAGQAMTRLMTPPPGALERISPETIVCRCEDITRSEIDAAFRDGAADLNQLKTRTRCGMGPCQGRICAPTVAALAMLHPGVTKPARPWTVRPPLRPVPIGDLVGTFSYDDIPSMKPAI